jgi:hypothetical protein
VQLILFVSKNNYYLSTIFKEKWFFRSPGFLAAQLYRQTKVNRKAIKRSGMEKSEKRRMSGGGDITIGKSW